MRVRALREGFYNNDLKRVGDIFDLVDAQQFSARWMVRVSSEIPHRKVSRELVTTRPFVPDELDGPLGGVRGDWDPWV